MRIIISPAKKMRDMGDEIAWERLPVFLEKAEIIKEYMRGLSFGQLQELLGCNQKITQQNYDRYRNMNLERNLTPALLSYEGIQYQYMAPGVFTEGQWNYVEKHLRILSGFYGILRPRDGVTPYRLEMQAKFSGAFWKNLYEFWGDDLYRELTEGDQTVVNLASKEYSKAVERYLDPKVNYITCIFGELENGKVRTKGTLAKMARGEMVRWMAEENICDHKQLKYFEGLGYHFAPEYSKEHTLTFLS